MPLISGIIKRSSRFIRNLYKADLPKNILPRNDFFYIVLSCKLFPIKKGAALSDSTYTEMIILFFDC